MIGISVVTSPGITGLSFIDHPIMGGIQRLRIVNIAITVWCRNCLLQEYLTRCLPNVVWTLADSSLLRVVFEDNLRKRVVADMLVATLPLS